MCVCVCVHVCVCVYRSTALQEKLALLQEKQERIKELEADLNNKIE